MGEKKSRKAPGSVMTRQGVETGKKARKTTGRAAFRKRRGTGEEACPLSQLSGPGEDRGSVYRGREYLPAYQRPARTLAGERRWNVRSTREDPLGEEAGKNDKLLYH